jgi:Flp pilus assembly protein TadG
MGGRPRERGAVAVEFAIIVPILLLLVFGVIQFGFFLAQQTTLNGAVRTGARFGSVNAFTSTHTCAAVIQRVRDAATTIGMNGSSVSVTVKLNGTTRCDTTGTSYAGAPCTDAAATAATPGMLSVQASYVSKYFVPMPLPGSSMTLKGTGSYQCEYH